MAQGGVRRFGGALASAGVAALAAVVPATPAFASGEQCLSEAFANKAVVLAHLKPASGSTVTASSPVTLSSISRAPLTFHIASAPELLLNPDVDSGLGTAGETVEGSQAYTFTSSKATAKAATIYWTASFSSSELPGCAGQPSNIFTTEAQTLIVSPPPPPTPSPSPPPSPEAPPAPLQTSINSATRFRLAYPAVVYRVTCSLSCSGQTAYEVFLRRAHRPATHDRRLDIRPVHFMISSAQGTWTFSRHLSAALIRRLRQLIRSGDVITLKLSTRVQDSAGQEAAARRTVRLQA